MSSVPSVDKKYSWKFAGHSWPFVFKMVFHPEAMRAKQPLGRRPKGLKSMHSLRPLRSLRAKRKTLGFSRLARAQRLAISVISVLSVCDQKNPRERNSVIRSIC